MHIFIRSLFAGLLVSALFLGCQRENLVEQKEYPRLRETVVLSVDETGATCRALFLSPGESEIVDHGFIWTKGGTPELNSSYDLKEEPKNMERLSLGKLATQSSFEGKLSYGLGKNSSYQVRSYLKTADGYTVYGHPVQFDSEGSLPPRITAFEPATAVWGDTITIVGENFSYLSGTVQVTFEGNNTSKVLSSTSTSIRCIVPNSVPYNTSKITVQVVGGKATSSESFKVDTSLPVITSVSPLTGSGGDTITIRGENFSGSRQYWYVEFKGGGTYRKAQAIKFSPHEIKAIVPELLFKEYQIRVLRTNSSQDFYSEPSSQPFRIAPPGLETLEIVPGPDMTRLRIKGSGFTNPRIFIDGKSINVLSYNQKEIIINPSEVVFLKPVSTLSVEVVVGEQRMSRQFSISYLNSWIRRASNFIKPTNYPTFPPATTFSYKGYGYALINNLNFPNNIEVHRFNPQNYEWQQLNHAPIPNKASNAVTQSFVIGRYAYILTQPSYSGSISFWRFDPEMETWESLPVPDTDIYSSQNSLLVVCNNDTKGYLFSNEKTGSLWEFDPAKKAWELKQTNLKPTDNNYFSGTFAINNKVYGIVTSYINRSLASIYEYDLNTTNWQLKTSFTSNFPSSFFQLFTGATTSKAYIGYEAKMFEYDPGTNKVSVLSQNNSIDNNSISGARGFAFQNKAFLFSNSNFWEVTLH